MAGLFDAYLAGQLAAFFAGDFARPEDRRRAVERALRPISPELARELAVQSAALPPSPARDAHLAQLGSGAAAVVTGQQAGLFLGPLYTVYKTASAVRLARTLSEETGRPVVPVFWLQVEDHDLPEIASCTIPGRSGALVTLGGPAGPAGDVDAHDRVPIAHRGLPAEVEGALARLREELGTLPHAEAHLARLARWYRPGVPYGRAMAGVMAELFAEEGLVIFDPRTPGVARLAAPLHRRALLEAEPIAAALEARARDLGSLGFDAPVHVRRGSPLSFFHPRGVEGPRYRLEPAPGGTFAEVGGAGTHAREALLAALEAEPLSFSTSALLRPVLEDTLFPTAAYVGGPGEIAYFAQLQPLYRALGVEMPLLVPRDRLRVLEEKTVRLCERLGVAARDAGLPEDELLARTRGGHPAVWAPDALEAEAGAAIDRALGEVLARIAPVGQGLDVAVEKTRQSMRGALGKLREKYERALLHQDAARVEDVRKLKALLHPNGAPQERVLGLAYFAARWGDRTFVERVLALAAPLDTAVKELVP